MPLDRFDALTLSLDASKTGSAETARRTASYFPGASVCITLFDQSTAGLVRDGLARLLIEEGHHVYLHLGRPGLLTWNDALETIHVAMGSDLGQGSISLDCELTSALGLASCPGQRAELEADGGVRFCPYSIGRDALVSSPTELVTMMRSRPLTSECHWHSRRTRDFDSSSNPRPRD